MTVARLVVDRRPAGNTGAHGLRIQRAVGDTEQLLSHIQQRPAIAIRHFGQRLTRFRCDGQLFALKRLSAPDQALKRAKVK